MSTTSGDNPKTVTLSVDELESLLHQIETLESDTVHPRGDDYHSMNYIVHKERWIDRASWVAFVYFISLNSTPQNKRWIHLLHLGHPSPDMLHFTTVEINYLNQCLVTHFNASHIVIQTTEISNEMKVCHETMPKFQQIATFQPVIDLNVTIEARVCHQVSISELPIVMMQDRCRHLSSMDALKEALNLYTGRR